MALAKRKKALEVEEPDDRPALLTPSKRARRNDLAGNSIVNAADFFSGAPGLGSGVSTPSAAYPGTAHSSGGPATQGPEASYLVHWQSVQLFLPLDEDVERRAWYLLSRTVRATNDFAAGELQVGGATGGHGRTKGLIPGRSNRRNDLLPSA